MRGAELKEEVFVCFVEYWFLLDSVAHDCLLEPPHIRPAMSNCSSAADSTQAGKWQPSIERPAPADGWVPAHFDLKLPAYTALRREAHSPRREHSLVNALRKVQVTFAEAQLDISLNKAKNAGADRTVTTRANDTHWQWREQSDTQYESK